MNLVEVVEALFSGPASPNAAEAAARLGDDMVMIEGGHNLRSGRHRGPGGLAALMKKVHAACDHFSSTMVWVKGDDRQVISLAHAVGARNGRTLDTYVLTIIVGDEHGQIIEIRDLPYDWTAWEEFWTN